MNNVWILGKAEVMQLKAESRFREKFTSMLYNDEELKKGIRQLKLKYNLSSDEFEELFQNTIVMFFKTLVLGKEVSEITDVRAYVYTIARNRLMTELSKPGFGLTESLDEAKFQGLASDQHQTEQYILRDERRTEIQKIIGMIGEKCRSVLMYWSSGYSMEEIAGFLGYKSAGMAKKKKHLCLAELIVLIEQKPALKISLLNLLK
ncbi:MAG: sigma-70 family RNA polymerase sigma factor [Saprospiraceae bacterium]|nr:sigma-70 family RNA polymerase sigma factor [Saprospiraceae bacterium]